MTEDVPDKSQYQALLAQGLRDESVGNEPDISGYEIVRLLGRGGMSKVYLAKETALNRLVALKIFNADAIDAICIERFHQEAQMMAQIQHYNIVSIYAQISYGEEIPCLILEYVPGGDLRSKLNNEGTISIADAARIAIDVCSGLEAIHAKSIVHRDINPANVLLDENGSAVVADLGIALDEHASDGLTMTGTFVGTMAYLAPEQIAGSRSDIDARTDIWSVGVLLFEMLVGVPPQALLVSDLLADVPGSVRPIMKRCLHRKPTDRYADISSLKRDLEQLLKPNRKKNFLMWGAIASLALALAGYVVFQISAKPSDQQASADIQPEEEVLVVEFETDVLKQFKQPLHPLRGIWSLEDGTLSCLSNDRGAIISLPVSSPGNNYDIAITVTRRSGKNSLSVFMPTSIGMMNFDLDGWSQHISGIQNLNGQDMRDHGEHFDFTLEEGATCELLLEIREKSISAIVDGELRYRWDITHKRGSLTNPWKISFTNQLALGVWKSSMDISKIKFKKYSN